MDSGMHETVEPSRTEAEVGHVESSGVSSIEKRKRGPSQGPVRLLHGEKRLIRTNRQGQPNLIDENTKAFMSDIGLQVRELLPVAYDEFDEIPKTRVSAVLDILEEVYDVRYVKFEWIKKKLRKAWRDRKYHLRMKYIRGKTVAAVKAGETPDFVTIEDWHKFINISTTPEFLAVSERNSTNRSKVEMPNGSGRHSMAQIRHMIAVEKNFASDDDVGRSEAYIQMLSNKRKPNHENIAELEALIRRKPETRPTGANDAVAQVFGEDTRTRMRTMGEAVSLNSLKDEEHLVNKISDAEKINFERESLVQKLSKYMVEFKEFVTNQLMKTRTEKNVCSSQSTALQTSSTV